MDWCQRASITAPNNTKLSKFLSSLFNDESFDVALSKVLQNRIVKGNFYVSIDPYDFLTMSVNRHGWSSCLSIENARGNGNAAGSFSYMLDSTTMVCYRSNDKDYDYDFKNVKFTGNSKSWRQLVHINKSNCAMMFNRQYPQNSNIDTASLVRELLETRIATYLGRENEWENMGNNDSWYKPSMSIAYNDSHNQTRVTVVPKGTHLKFNIDSGAKIVCLNCGKVGDRANCCS